MRFIIGIIAMLLTATAFTQSVKMKINGVTAVSGEDVLAFQTGVTAATSVTSGGSPTIAKSAFDKIEFKKTNNTSTNTFFQKINLGQKLGDATFEFYDAAGTMYYKIFIADVYVTKFAYLVPECTGCNKMYHDVGLVFQKIEITDVTTGNTLKYNITSGNFY